MEPDFDLICDYYARLERQGPGSPEITRQALGFVDGLNASSRIADMGCGTGGQTLELARHVPGTITGIDMLEPFIDQLNANAARIGLADRVVGRVGSMEKLPFNEKELDLIWSEGAIYNMGFERGLKAWRPFLKPSGFIAVSEISWFTEDRPPVIQDFWTAAYPEMDTIANKEKSMRTAGYELISSFRLPVSCWTDNYYIPQGLILDDFLKKHSWSDDAKALVAEQQQEAELYDRFKEYYGYAFYIGQKDGK